MQWSKSCMYSLHVVNLANFWIIYNLNVLQYFKKLEPTSEGCNNPAWCIVYAKLTSEIITFHVSEWRRNKFQKNPLSGIHWIFITCHDKNMSTCKWQDRQQDRYDDSNIPILVCRPGYISIIQRAMIYIITIKLHAGISWYYHTIVKVTCPVLVLHHIEMSGCSNSEIYKSGTQGKFLPWGTYQISKWYKYFA